MEYKPLIPVESQNLIQEALEYLGSIKEIAISTDQEYNATLAMCKDVKKKYNNLEKERKGITGPLNDKIKEINTEFKIATDKLSSFERTSKQAAGVYYNKKEQLRIAQQQKLEAEAAEQRRKAEEKARLEAEKVARYEAEGKQKLADQARAREEAAQAKAVQTVAPVIEQSKPQGTSFKTVFEATVEDKAKFIEFCLKYKEGPMAMFFDTCIQVDLKQLERFANTSKGTIKAEGINYATKTIASVRT